MAAEQSGGIVAPPDYWHIHELGGYALWSEESIGNVPRTWLTAVPPWIHFKNICYQIRAADAIGFHAAILLTGHYGPNWQDLKTLVALVQPHCGVRLYGLPDFECNKPGFDGDGASGDHAGKVETSLLWALEPGCVDVSRIPPVGTSGKHYAMGQDARQANRRTGERMASDEAAWLGAKGKQLLADYDQLQPTTRLRTFLQVEQLWNDVVQPHLNRFESMQEAWEGSPKKTVEEGSTWYANWHVPTIP
jgi:creatinine amidohydrolase